MKNEVFHSFLFFRNSNEPVPTRIEVLTTIFDKYLWFKMTDQVRLIIRFRKKN